MRENKETVVPFKQAITVCFRQVDKLPTTFSDRLKELRTRRSWSQPELAARFSAYVKTHKEADDTRKHNYSPQQISEWETGATPRADLLRRFAEFFGVSLEYMLGMTDDEQSVLKEEGLSESERALIQQLRQHEQEASLVYRMFGIAPPTSKEQNLTLVKKANKQISASSSDEAANS